MLDGHSKLLEGGVLHVDTRLFGTRTMIGTAYQHKGLKARDRRSQCS
jgi:hypothetical protein